MGCRRLLALIEGLPADAAVWQDDHHGWTQAHELAALAVEVSDQWGRILAQAWGLKKLPKPPEITHPGRPRSHPARKLTSDPREIQAWFAQHMRR